MSIEGRKGSYNRSKIPKELTIPPMEKEEMQKIINDLAEQLERQVNINNEMMDYIKASKQKGVLKGYFLAPCSNLPFFSIQNI